MQTRRNEGHLYAWARRTSPFRAAHEELHLSEQLFTSAPSCSLTSFCATDWLASMRELVIPKMSIRSMQTSNSSNEFIRAFSAIMPHAAIIGLKKCLSTTVWPSCASSHTVACTNVCHISAFAPTHNNHSSTFIYYCRRSADCLIGSTAKESSARIISAADGGGEDGGKEQRHRIGIPKWLYNIQSLSRMKLADFIHRSQRKRWLRRHINAWTAHWATQNRPSGSKKSLTLQIHT